MYKNVVNLLIECKGEEEDSLLYSKDPHEPHIGYAS